MSTSAAELVTVTILRPVPARRRPCHAARLAGMPCPRPCLLPGNLPPLSPFKLLRKIAAVTRARRNFIGEILCSAEIAPAAERVVRESSAHFNSGDPAAGSGGGR